MSRTEVIGLALGLLILAALVLLLVNVIRGQTVDWHVNWSYSSREHRKSDDDPGLRQDNGEDDSDG